MQALLHPADIDVASEGVKGHLGVHFYFLAERKTFLLSWKQNSWPASDVSLGFATLLLRQFFRKPKNSIVILLPFRGTTRNWDCVDAFLLIGWNRRRLLPPSANSSFYPGVFVLAAGADGLHVHIEGLWCWRLCRSQCVWVLKCCCCLCLMQQVRLN